MQNEPNFGKAQMNVNLYNTTDYEEKSDWTPGENEPNSKPIKANFRKAKMNVNSLITKDYRKNDAFAVQKNKANSKPNKANFKPGFGIDVGAYSCDIIMIVYGNQPEPGPPIRVADKSRSLFRILQSK